MLHKILALGVALTLSMGILKVSAAEVDSAEPATVVIYRAGELPKTARISLDMHVDEGSLGRLNADGSLVVSGQAGQYTLGSSIAGTQPLVIDLKPGQVHYIHTEMTMQGTRVLVSLTEVEEQVARVQAPALDATI